jgi:hypothetical protein
MRWDRTAIRAGAGVCLVFAVPFSVGARVAADADNSELAVALSLGAVAGFLVGAGCAAWLQRVGTPLSHGIVTAGATYLAAQTVFIAVRLVRGDSVSWFAAVFNLTIVVGAGLLGGVLGQRLRSNGLVPSTERTRSEDLHD